MDKNQQHANAITVYEYLNGKRVRVTIRRDRPWVGVLWFVGTLALIAVCVGAAALQTLHR